MDIIERVEKIILSIDEENIKKLDVLEKFIRNITVVIPKLEKYKNIKAAFYKDSNVFLLEEVAKRLVLADKDVYIRLAILFCDLGIKGEEIIDVDIESYLLKVSRRSQDISKEILKEIGYSENEISYINKLILYRNMSSNELDSLRDLKVDYGQKIVKDLLRIIKIDLTSLKDEILTYKQVQCKIIEDEIIRMKDENVELRLKDLDITGKDLELINYNNIDSKRILNNLLDLAKCDCDLNEKNILIGLAQNF